jgi:septum site-determining protein MinC
MRDEIVSIKGVKDGLLIALDPTEEWRTVNQELASRIDEKLDFFKGARVTVNFGERPVPKYDLSGLKALLERRGLTLVVVQSESETTISSAHSLDLRVSTIRKQVPNTPDRLTDGDTPVSPEEQGNHGIMVKHTLRSGRRVQSRGHVVVYGDVNPGAEIIASGDIIIWGKLRGTVHAGADGDETAIVCALMMMPTQLRIAGLIVISPPGKQQEIEPEVALIRDNQIVVDSWK